MDLTYSGGDNTKYNVVSKNIVNNKYGGQAQHHMSSALRVDKAMKMLKGICVRGHL